MAAGKTGALLAASAAIGAVLAGAPAVHCRTLSRTFGAELGLAFQLVDDVLGIWGDPGGHRQAGPLRPAGPQEVAAGHATRWAGVTRRPGADRLAGRRAAEPTEAAVARVADLLVEVAGPRLGAQPRPGGGWTGPRQHCPRWTSSRRPGPTWSSWPSSSWRDELVSHSAAVRSSSEARSRMTSIAHGSAAAGGDRGRAARRSTAAVGHLRGLQHADGWWKGELETNVTMDAEDLLLREFLGIRTERGDGRGGPLDPVAAARRRHLGQLLRRPGRPVDHGRGLGGAAAGRRRRRRAAHAGRAGVRPRRTAASRRPGCSPGSGWPCSGCGRWDDLPELPPELILLPRWFPLNVYDWACWARQTIVPLTVVAHSAPGPSAAASASTSCAPGPPRPAPSSAVRPGRARSQRLDTGAARLRPAPGRGRCGGCAMRRAAEWILARQEADGSWGGIQPPWVYSLLALHLLGYPLDHPAVTAGIAGLDGFVVREQTPDGIGPPARGLPVAGLGHRPGGDRPARRRGAGRRRRGPRGPTDWLLAEEIRVPGDWSVRRPDLAPGGWAFEFANDGYPDTDDTAEVVLALRRVGRPARGPGGREPGRRLDGRHAVSATAAGARSTPTTPGPLANQLPFCDFGEVIDPPSADVTAHVVEMLAAEGRGAEPAARRGVRVAARRPGARRFVVRPLGRQPRLRHRRGRPGAGRGRGVARRVGRSAGRCAWLDRAPGRRRRLGRGPALLPRRRRGVAGARRPRRRRRGRCWPCWPPAGRTTRSSAASAGWSTPSGRTAAGTSTQFTGTGFPGDFYINYHLYRLVFPISALGRYLRRRRRDRR